METRSGWRATPAPLLVSFAVWIVYALARIVMNYKVEWDHINAVRLNMIGEGVGFACGALLMLGAAEMMNRAAPADRGKLKLATVAAGVAFVADTSLVLLQFTKEPWSHTTAYTLYQVVTVVAWSLVALGFTLVASPKHRVFGFVALAFTILVFLPQQVGDKLWRAVSLDGKSLYTVILLLNIVRLALLGYLVTQLPQHETQPKPHEAAEGLRSVARGLFIRVIVALMVAVFVVMMSMGRGAGEGAVSFFKLLMMTQIILGVVALAISGFGALRAARSGLHDLSPWTLTIGGGASLWATGVTLVQVPMIYQMFYGKSSGLYGGRELREMSEVLSLAMPVIVILGVGLIATAVAGYAARRGKEDLRSDAQGKGLGYVVLTLVAIAIITWMLPKARKVESGAFLMLLAAGASLWGTIMIAKLFQRAADIFETEPGLPPASIVSDGSPPPA
jgi:hypothetical protein